MVHGDEVEAVPRTLLHRDLVAERLHELIALGRLKERNWIMARSPRMPATCAAEALMKIAR